MLELIHGLGDELGTTIVVVTHQPEVAATFPRTVTMQGGRVGAEGRDGSEYVVIGAEGVVHLPSALVAGVAAGHLVRIEPEERRAAGLSRPDRAAAGSRRGAGGRVSRPRGGTRSTLRRRRAPCSTASTLTFRAGEVTARLGSERLGQDDAAVGRRRHARADAGDRDVRRPPMWLGTGDPRPEVAFVLQVYGLVPILSARENVSVALRARGVTPAEADERAEAALARSTSPTSATDRSRSCPAARCSASRCAAGLRGRRRDLLADEPTSELDEGNRGMVLDELRAEADARRRRRGGDPRPGRRGGVRPDYVLDEGGWSTTCPRAPPRAGRGGARPGLDPVAVRQDRPGCVRGERARGAAPEPTPEPAPDATPRHHLPEPEPAPEAPVAEPVARPRPENPGRRARPEPRPEPQPEPEPEPEPAAPPGSRPLAVRPARRRQVSAR